MLYSSIPTLFLLVISSLIWNAEYTRNGNPSPTLPPLDRSHHPILAVVLDSLAKLGRGNLKSGISRGVGDVSGEWINEATLRKVVGGSSALVALSGASFVAVSCARTDDLGCSIVRFVEAESRGDPARGVDDASRHSARCRSVALVNKSPAASRNGLSSCVLRPQDQRRPAWIV